MAIEDGLVLLIQSGMGSPPMAPGGFMVKLPKDLIVPGSTTTKAWVWKAISSTPTYILEGQDGFTALHWQIDCHGLTATDSIDLANAIDAVLRGGYMGTLPDTAQTVVQGIFGETGPHDGYDSDSKTYVRILEYLINYNAP